MYRNWLYFTCKWATKGLDSEEFKKWQRLSMDLDKYCIDCKEGYICEICHNIGIKLTGIEEMIIKNIEMSLNANKVNEVN